MGTKRSTGPINRLSNREVQCAGDGELFDGGGLLLRVKAGRAKWVFRRRRTLSKISAKTSERSEESLPEESDKYLILGRPGNGDHWPSELRRSLHAVEAQAAVRRWLARTLGHTASASDSGKVTKSPRTGDLFSLAFKFTT
jgi:hypothetical protein